MLIFIVLFFLFFVIDFGLKVELLFTLGAKMIGIFNNPLPETLIMEKVFTRKQSCFSHILEAHHTGVIMMFFNFFKIDFLKIFHSISKFLNPIIRPVLERRVT